MKYIDLSFEEKREYHRIAQKKYADKNKHKIKAHNLINNNNLKGECCEKCLGIINLEALHPNYNEPENIITSCRIHHNEIHHAK